MAVDLNDYFRTFYEGPLTILPQPTEAHMTGAARLLEKRSEMKEVEEALDAHKEGFQMRRERAQLRENNLTERKQQLKEQLIRFDAFVKENDSKCSRAKKKVSADMELVRQKELEIERLETEITILLAKKHILEERVQRNAIYWEFLIEVTKSSKKFEEIRDLLGRIDTLLVTREQLLLKDSEGQAQREALRLELRRFLQEQGNDRLHHNNQLSALQTQLDHTRMQAFKWESAWNHIQSTAAKETLLLGQIKVVTLNLFHMMGGKTGQDKAVAIEDTVQQLEQVGGLEQAVV